MTPLSGDEFIEFVKRSGLVEEKRLASALASIQHEGGYKAPSQVIANLLLREGLLTAWQIGKLLEKKYKGFFLGKYKLREILPYVGMCAMYVADHTLIRRRVMIVVLPANLCDNPVNVAKFLSHAHDLAVLDHENIIRLFDADHDIPNIPYLVLEHVGGQDLETLVKTKGPPSFAWSAHIILQAAKGLAYSHKWGIFHRGVRPSSIWHDESDFAKILFVSLSCFSENRQELADYFAPELVSNSQIDNAIADIYSLGCTLYFLLTGHPPFPHGTLAQRISKHQCEIPVNIQRERPTCPDDLKSICDKMMEKEPKNRYATMQEVVTALGEWSARNQDKG